MSAPMATPQPDADLRVTRLTAFFKAVLSGNQVVQAAQRGKLFIEAICAQPDPSSSIYGLVSSKAGLAAVQACMRFDLTPVFLNGPATDLLQYLRPPSLKAISGGQILRQIIVPIVQPPIFWDAFVQAYWEGRLHQRGTEAFAWLLYELLSLPAEQSEQYHGLAQDLTNREMLLGSPHLEIRVFGQRIKNRLATLDTPASLEGEAGPGGRHDNDHVDFRCVAILPTADELASTEPPFLRLADALDDPAHTGSRLALHLENQFRLFREDMLSQLREELLGVLSEKQERHRGLQVSGLRLRGMDSEPDKYYPWALQFQCAADFPGLRKGSIKSRKAHLDKNPSLFRHKSLACLVVDGVVVTFATVNRKLDLLALEPPIIVLEFNVLATVAHLLLKLPTAQQIRLVQIDTAVFAYAPVLTRLQEITHLPLLEQLLAWHPTRPMRTSPDAPGPIIDRIRAAPPSVELQKVFKTTISVQLDESQTDSLVAGLADGVSLIQGPPGTGKSFIGALLAKILHDTTDKRILVVCYTNHALDQFLEDLLDIGIPPESLVRLGSKSTTRTEPLGMAAQSFTFRGSKQSRRELDILKSRLDFLRRQLITSLTRYQSSAVQKLALMHYLEFEDCLFYDGLTVPGAAVGMTQIGRKGKVVDRFYLFDRWSQGLNPGIFAEQIAPTSRRIWDMDHAARLVVRDQWILAIRKERVKDLSRMIGDYNNHVDQLKECFGQKVPCVLRNKRIIGCTTTAAAMYVNDLQIACPDVLLVEEAGEILESHVLTALGWKTSQMILIGDHKQLRPKINNHRLSVERGEGFDLNRSLFERLILKGFPHHTLSKQHRMRPEISSLVRHMTYPGLLDAPGTLGRPDLRGVHANVVFVNHSSPENDEPQIKDQEGRGSSKQNSFEGSMVLKCLRYLAQQGYGQDKMVVLTPYLGQLSLLRNLLSKDNDPVLNDRDSSDLVGAGLRSPMKADLTERSIRIATIDNYQGEESDIVIATLTRSNPSCNIGFMAEPERLNVLLSRARNALIMIGHAETFLHARKGKEAWTRFFDLLRQRGGIYEGLPVRCEQHHDRTALLRRPEDFDEECPDGGCKEPCGTMLSCGLHACPKRCHPLRDHSKIPCESVLYGNCPNGHPEQWRCHRKRPLSCRICDREAANFKRKQEQAFQRQQKEDAARAEHAKQMQHLDEQLDAQVQAQKDGRLIKERADAIKQKEADLAVARAQKIPMSSSTSTEDSASTEGQTSPDKDDEAEGGLLAPATPQPPPPREARRTQLTPQKSAAEREWRRQKEVENVRNAAIDSIMDMIGLEKVKSQVLRIKAKVDATTRQSTSLSKERFNAALLGNPGTGKTTVARLYAKFLSLVDVLPGNAFIETTGSRLANGGVPELMKHLQEIEKAGGGALFVDETYQMTAPHNLGGKSVLDFLLAEMENRMGQMVFIFAGYNREMETFFEHNPGIPRRIPYTLQFADYEDTELLTMLGKLVLQKYNGKMKVADEMDGLYARIAISRLGRGRGRPGFGNAGALQNMFAKITERQADRLNRERRDGRKPDDFQLTKEDLIGPNPSTAILCSKAWEKLQKLVGLEAVKESLRAMIATIETNYRRELKEQKPMETSLNKFFLGPPGTGKTSVAKLYGQILADLGLLSNGEVVVKNPADFIGSALGQSESQTKAILANTVGKVLIIDEAYMLSSSGAGGTVNQGDPYKTAVIDTIVAEVQSIPGDDRCVLLLGYEDQMLEMLQNSNPGLARRFPVDGAFYFHDFSKAELGQILELKLKDQDLEATEKAKAVALDVLGRARARPNFGNAGEVENLLSRAKSSFQSRQLLKPLPERVLDVIFGPEDFDPDFDREAGAATNLQKLFADVVGCDDVVAKLQGYQQIARAMKARDLNPRDQIPTNFVFKGPPGTGKTTTARKMGKVFYDMGFLSSTDVIEASASDLVGQFVGQTGPKTRNLLEKALGKVLFLDEAYRLSEGHFASEAIDELVDATTKPKFFGKLIVILAGYDADINKLMAVNTGLSSRFAEEIIFRDMSPAQCLQLLDRTLEKQQIRVTALHNGESQEKQEMERLVGELASLGFWGNARDIQTLAKDMVRAAFRAPINATSTSASPSSSSHVALTFDDALHCIKTMVAGRRARCGRRPDPARRPSVEKMLQRLDAAPRPTHHIQTSTAQNTETPPPDEDKQPLFPGADPDTRDAGVSDATWTQLQADQMAATTAAQRVQAVLTAHQRALQQAQDNQRAEAARVSDLAQKQAEAANDAKVQEAKRLHEEARLREQVARRAREEALAALERAREEEENRRREEAKIQAKLRDLGLCPFGFQWIKQQNGYRCAGGTHFVDNAQLGL